MSNGNIWLIKSFLTLQGIYCILYEYLFQNVKFSGVIFNDSHYFVFLQISEQQVSFFFIKLLIKADCYLKDKSDVTEKLSVR